MSNFIHDRAKREQIKAEKEAKILAFIKEEGFTEAKIIATLLDTTPTTAYRTLNKMAREELVKLYDVTGKALGRQGKQVVWGLTQTGALAATDANAEEFNVGYFEVSKLKEVTMKHSLELQRVKVKALKEGWTDWKGSRQVHQMANKDRSVWLRVPDALAVTPKGYLAAIELERTVKTPKRYEEILGDYTQMLSNRTITEVYYFCPDRLVAGIERLFKEIKKIVVNGKLTEVPEGLLKRFHFISYSEWLGEES